MSRVKHDALVVVEDGVLLPFLRSPFNYDRNRASDMSGLLCDDPSRTVQSFADEVDINNIVERFLKTNQMPGNFNAPQYGDFTGVTDYQSALNQVIAANDAFMQMPAGLRARFHNNPQNLLDFMGNPDNLEEAIKLGIVKAPERVIDPVVQGSGTPPQGDSSKSPVGDSKGS